MRIKMLLSVRVEGEIWAEGEEHEAPVGLARLFIASNQAVALDALPAAPPLTTKGETTVETRDPRRRR
jgi:hypothetical protein